VNIDKASGVVLFELHHLFEKTQTLYLNIFILFSLMVNFIRCNGEFIAKWKIFYKLNLIQKYILRGVLQVTSQSTQ
jgi:hypothetical protein